MSIKIRYDFEKNKVITDTETTVNNFEYSLLQKIINELDLTDAIINNNTTDYTTLNYKGFDIVRIKYTNKSKWISIFLSDEDKKIYNNSALFEAQKKKTQLHWKSKLYDDNLEPYYQLIRNRCLIIEKKQ